MSNPTPPEQARALAAGAAACLLAFGSAACAPRRPEGSPSARPEIVEALRADLDAPRSAADGAGSVRLLPEESGPDRVEAGGEGRWVFEYTAGPEGIAVGGALYLQISPFWGWSTPQVELPDAPGFTAVGTRAVGVELRAETVDTQLLAIHVGGRPLAAGEVIRVDYGAGGPGATADRYAERGSSFWFAVDGDGDGVRRLLPGPPTIDVFPGPVRQAVVTGPSVVRPGAPFRLRIALLDGVGNAFSPWEGELGVRPLTVPCLEIPGVECDLGTELAAPASVAFEAAQHGVRSLDLEAPAGGIYLVDVEGPDGIAGRSNPIVVSADLPAPLWGDLHGHSQLSDGTATPDDYFRYARDVAALDVSALTDHDHWGMEPLGRHPELWEEIRAAVHRFDDPGRFVALLAFEWTNWLYGHRHVLYFTDEGRVYDSIDPSFETPEQLWEALRGQKALTVAHHTAGGPVATDWSIPPDPELEPVTEVVSVHGASEAPDAPGVIYDAVPGNFVRDALARGYVLGFIGSGDTHDGHPGLGQLMAPTGGLAALLGAEATRGSVLATLKARHTYATSGPRIVLAVTLDDEPMGSTISPREQATLEVTAIAPERLDRVDVVRSGVAVLSVPLSLRAHHVTHVLSDLMAGEYVYVRVIQENGGAAWSSPFFVR
ncbi:MAG: CehA/McbA family metallohydrolase [Thermoanaerobaculia bacterium]